MTSLKGKTLFITGASRGIGLAIALRAARDGANIAIAAKTTEPHPKLKGTIFDLMMGINTRGTFMVSKYCVPHLKKAENPHILMLSPPLDMKPKWFERSTAYSIAKYGMSLCVLGLSAELKSSGIAVNALWPRTTIATAAVGNLLGGDAMMRASRTPEIMGDAAYAIFTRPAREFTGNFCIDDKLLYASGVRDFDRYRVDASVPLMSDFFVPDDDVPPPGVTVRPLPPR
jgi:citronellol/citronellal dehydrogenase